MNQLIALLEKTGVGFITGNYKSYYGFSEIEIGGRKIMNVIFSINNKKLGEYPVLIEGKSKIQSLLICTICDSKGKSFCPFEDSGDHIFVDLTALSGSNDDIGTFILRGPWGFPAEFKPE